jgi:hypothetical protein
MDASLVGLWYFGMFNADNEKIVSTMEAMRERLMVRTNVGGMARYENDYYHQVSDDIDRAPGNPWFICTLWLAQWYIAAATEQGPEPDQMGCRPYPGLRHHGGTGPPVLKRSVIGQSVDLEPCNLCCNHS